MAEWEASPGTIFSVLCTACRKCLPEVPAGDADRGKDSPECHFVVHSLLF